MKKVFISIITFVLLASLPVFADIENQNKKYYAEVQNHRFIHGTSYLINAIIKNRQDIVQQMIDADFDMNKTFCTLPVILYAMHLKRYEIFEMMLNAGTEPNTVTKGYSLLHFSIYYHSPRFVELLIKYGADVNLKSKGITPLNYALETNQSDIVELLRQSNAIEDENTIKLMK